MQVQLLQWGWDTAVRHASLQPHLQQRLSLLLVYTKLLHFEPVRCPRQRARRSLAPTPATQLPLAGAALPTLQSQQAQVT